MGLSKLFDAVCGDKLTRSMVNVQTRQTGRVEAAGMAAWRRRGMNGPEGA